MRKLVLAVIAVAFALAVWAPAGGAAAQTSVAISGSGCAGGSVFCFSPAELTIHDGDAVVWTNQTTAPHTVTRCTPAACAGTGGGTGTDATFTSGNVGAGTGMTFSHTFHGTGTYTYFCTIHGFAVMHGTVTVIAAASVPTTPATIAAVPSSRSTTPATRTPGSGGPTTTQQPPNRALAQTGTDTSRWAIIAAALVVAGALLTHAKHRRSAHDNSAEPR
jgi:LPXTG-motif cell wall-anchored protein